MTIEVKLFASLRESLGHANLRVDAEQVKTVADVWVSVAGDKPMPANMLMAVNMEYVDASQAVRAGDEVAFFPPVTGG